MHESTRPSAAPAAQLLVALLALGLGACGASQAAPATAEQATGPAAEPAEPRPEPPPAAPCIAQSLASYEREAAFACLLEVDHPQEDLVDMGLQESTRAKVMERFGQLDQDTLAPLLAVIDEAMAPDPLRQQLVEKLSAASDAQITAVLQYSATPLGRTERMLMEADTDEQAFQAWAESEALTDARAELAWEVCQATGVAAIAELLVEAPAVGMTTSMVVALEPEKAPQLDELKAQLKAQLAPGVEAFQHGLCTLLAYTTRSLTDAEMREVASFYRSPEASGYLRVQLDAFDSVLSGAYSRVGTAMAPATKQLAEAQGGAGAEGDEADAE